MRTQRERIEYVYNYMQRNCKSVTIDWRMFHIILFEPEIPPNTGNVIRLCANTGCELHLIEPLGFSLEEKAMRRAGLDYHDSARTHVHANFEQALNDIKKPSANLYALSTHGVRQYTDVAYKPGDILLFGPETRGLPTDVRNGSMVEDVLRLPMLENNRSLNLSNTVAIVCYEAWRQNNFAQP